MKKSNKDIPILWTPVENAIRAIANGRRVPERVLILGAGMAGMGAAYELGKRNEIKTIDILEASPRVGGRVWTHKFEGTDQYAEFGAMRIPEVAHDYTFHYIDEFDIEMREFISSSNTGLYDIRGTIARTDNDGREEIVKKYPNLRITERQIIIEKGAGALLSLVMVPLMRKLADDNWKLGRLLVAGNMTDPYLKNLDTYSMRSYLLEQVEKGMLSPDGMAAIGAMTSLEARWLWSLAANLRGVLTNQPRSGKGLVEIKGGFGRLPEKMEKILNSEAYKKVTIHRGHAVTEINIVRDKIAVTSTGSKNIWNDYDKVICTLPFGVMRLIDLKGFSLPKLSAIRNIKYSSSTKVLLMCKSAFWRKGIIPMYGSSISDRLSRQTYYPSPETTVPRVAKKESSDDLYWDVNSITDDRPIPLVKNESEQEERRVLLGSYSWSTNSRQLGNLTRRDDDPGNEGNKIKDGIDSDRARHVINDLTHIHPELKAQFEKSASIYWDEHKWSKGAFAITPPGDLSTYFAGSISLEARGNLVFAGEHVSIAPGWIQGALQSGLKAAAIIVNTSKDGVVENEID